MSRTQARAKSTPRVGWAHRHHSREPWGAIPLPAGNFLRQSVAAAGLAPDLYRLEAGVTPADDEEVEALLHAQLDVVRVGGVAAIQMKFLARGKHLLDGVFPALGIAAEDA